MTIMRKASLVAGAAVLMSAASASAAFAANPITLTQANGVLTIDDPTGVNQAEVVSDNAGNYIDIQELNSGDELQAGSGVLVSINYSTRHWVIAAPGGAPITKVIWQGRAGSNGLDASGLSRTVSAYGGSGVDFITGSPQKDVINGGAGNDSIHAGAGNDTITGFDGSDDIYGEDGDDTIYESDGYADTINGGNGNDSASIDSTDTLIAIETII